MRIIPLLTLIEEINKDGCIVSFLPPTTKPNLDMIEITTSIWKVVDKERFDITTVLTINKQLTLDSRKEEYLSLSLQKVYKELKQKIQDKGVHTY